MSDTAVDSPFDDDDPFGFKNITDEDLDLLEENEEDFLEWLMGDDEEEI